MKSTAHLKIAENTIDHIKKFKNKCVHYNVYYLFVLGFYMFSKNDFFKLFVMMYINIIEIAPPGLVLKHLHIMYIIPSLRGPII